jgi:hypothetical protein
LKELRGDVGADASPGIGDRHFHHIVG